MAVNSDVKALGDFVRNQVSYLSKDISCNRATLSRLRRAVGMPPGADPEIWTQTLGDLPEGLSGKGRTPSPGEWATHVALTLYAIHVQSSDAPAQEDGVGLGKAVGRLAAGYNSKSQDANPHQKRMAEASRSDGIEVLSWRLRSIVRLLGREGIGIDYGRLAMDLYWFQFERSRPQVVLNWGRGYSMGLYEAGNKPDKKDSAVAAGTN